MGDNTAAVPTAPTVPAIDGRLGATNQAAGEVMIVDDEPITARGYARALTSAGYKVTVASAGREGATLARSKRFDVIVSDISMPDMNGLALLRDIRQSDLDVPMIFMTGSPALETRWRRSSTARSATSSSRCRWIRCWRWLPGGRRAQAGARAARGKRAQGAGGEADRGSRGPRGALHVGGREAVGGGAADRFVDGEESFAYETLLRTDEPTLRSPLDFFDAAERLGKAAELGRIIRRHVAALLAGPPPGHVFVNLHPADLEDAELYADDGALTPYASKVVLEITERAALDGIHELARG